MDDSVVISSAAFLNQMQKEAQILPQLGRAARYVGRHATGLFGGKAGQAAGRVTPPTGSIKEWAAGLPERARQYAATEKGQAWKGRLLTSGGMSAAGAGLGAATGEEGTRGRRAVAGAMLGGLGGLGVGQFVTRAGRQQALRTGQRQLHSMTGYLPGRGIIGRGPEGTKWYRLGQKGAGPSRKERMRALEKMKMDIEGPTLAEAREQVRGQYGTGRLAKMRENLKARTLSGRREAAERELTSLPGFIKGLRPGQTGETLKTGLAAGGVLGGAGMAAFTLPALPGYIKQQSIGGTPENVGQIVGETLGYTAGYPLPFVGNLALGSLGGTVGKYIGRGVGAVTGSGRRQQPVGQVAALPPAQR